MDDGRRTWRIGDLARLSGVSVRTLHHYDAIGLLRPSGRTTAGYRVYGRDELLRLQQILLYRRIDLPLAEIRRILDEPGFDPADTLRDHRIEIEHQIERATTVLETIDRTLRHLEGATMPLNDDQLYEGLTADQRRRYPSEARERFGEAEVRASEDRIRTLSPEAWARVRGEEGAVSRALADAMVDTPPDDPAIQELVSRYRRMLGHFYEITPERYLGLAHLYTEDPAFRAHFEEIAPGLAEYLRAAIEVYVSRAEPSTT